MAWIRTGVFVSLTLVATTLPVIARPAPVIEDTQPSSNQHPTPAATLAEDFAANQGAGENQPGGSEGSQKPSQKSTDDGGLLLQSAWQMDVWKSGPARELGNSGPQLIAAITGCSPAVAKPSPVRGQDLQSHASRVHEHAREWLACRYPNAPPLAA